MPNWVYNDLLINGVEEDIAKIREQLGKPVPDENGVVPTTEEEIAEKVAPFSFWNICSPPEKYRKIYNGVSDKTADPVWGWYAYNNREWGTKWDASDIDRTVDNPESIGFSFSTAWSPPIPAIEKLSAQYPKVEILLHWEEEQGFGADMTFSEGTYTVTDEWDTPESHEENMNRKDYCWACDEYGNDPSQMDELYEDCPAKKEFREMGDIPIRNDIEVLA